MTCHHFCLILNQRLVACLRQGGLAGTAASKDLVHSTRPIGIGLALSSLMRGVVQQETTGDTGKDDFRVREPQMNEN